MAKARARSADADFGRLVAATRGRPGRGSEIGGKRANNISTPLRLRRAASRAIMALSMT